MLELQNVQLLHFELKLKEIDWTIIFYI
jgi:hypothetical protein